MPTVPASSGRGGSTATRVMRWMWNHSPNSSSSGTPMCTNTKSENRRSLTAPEPRKLRAIGVGMKGRASIHSALAMAENWPSWSQLSQKPPIAVTKAKPISGTPVSQLKRRKPRSCPCSHSRSRCRPIASTIRSAL